MILANLGWILMLCLCIVYRGDIAVYRLSLWAGFAAFASLSAAHWLMFFYYRWFASK
ncbi:MULTISPECIES: hypothetical protein [unclassified Agarivorans]|uniref:hypothetical protein n=1 Tax=unclassified Agarivorans TaxID=2636026 RepID=UPI003D7C7819